MRSASNRAICPNTRKDGAACARWKANRPRNLRSSALYNGTRHPFSLACCCPLECIGFGSPGCVRTMSVESHLESFGGRITSGPELPQRLSVADNHDRAAAGREVFLREVDAQRRIEAGGDVIGSDRFGLRARSGFIGFTDDLSSAHPSASEQTEHRPRVVVAAAFGRALVDLGRATKLAGDEDAGGVEQPFG